MFAVVALFAITASAGDGVDAATRARFAAHVHADALAIRAVPGTTNEFTTVNGRGGVRGAFSERGFAFTELRPGEPRVEMRLARVGRAERLADVAPSAPALASDTRVEYRHDSFVEWYRNDESGLEQGVTFAARPDGAGDLRIEYSWTSAGGIEPRVAPTRDGLDFVANQTAMLRLAGLHAFDRDGDAVPVRYELDGDRIVMIVADAAADYPLTVDPVASAPAFAAEGNFVDAQFGISVATAGDVDGDGYSDIIVGASNFSGGQSFEGKAYVFLGSATGLASSSAWDVAGGQANAYFGRAVSSAGDVNDDGYSDVLVGAQLYDDDQLNEGRALLFLGGPSGLASTPASVINGDETEAQFGQTLAAAGDVDGDGDSDVVIGASLFNFGALSNSGLVGVFLGNAGGIGTTPSPVLGGAQAEARFGTSVASAGDIDSDGFADIAIGSALFDDTKVDEGKIFVHHGSAIGVSTTASFSVVGNQTSAQLGLALGTAGDVNGDGYSDLIVGAPLFDFGEPDEGRAYVYHGSATGLAASPAWTTESNQTNARHGNAVTTAGDTDGDGYSDVAVAALLWDGTLTDMGRVLVYHGSLTGLSTTAAQELLGSQSSEAFGQSLAFAGDVNGDGLSDLAVGAQSYSNGQAAEGHVVVYHGIAGLPPTAFQWAQKGGQTDAAFGTAAGYVGDANGDGYADVYFGAPNFDATKLNEGKVTAHYGSATGLTATAGFGAVGGQNGAQRGGAVVGVGDVNGDGYDDLLTGAIGYDGDDPDIGSARLHLGSASGLALIAAQEILGTEPAARFSGSIAGVGDVDGDGFVDVLIGASDSSVAFNNGGTVQLHRGGASGIEPDPSWTRDALAANESFGFDMASLGDVDQDGFSDFAIGAPGSNTSIGRVEVFLGSASGPGASPDTSIAGVTAGERFGHSISTAGDVNGDGFSDAVFGAQNAARIHNGSGAGIGAVADSTLVGESSTGQFGREVACAGDLDRDGFSDVIVGAPLQFSGEVAEGKVYVFRGGASGVEASSSYSAESNQTNAEFGSAVAGSGDIDGDGTPDLVITAPKGENGFTDEGRGFVYYGNGEGGVARGIRQRSVRSDQTAPIAHLGRSFDTSYRVETLARSPFGRSSLTMQLETKALGVAFDGASLVSSSAQDTGTSGVVVALSTGVLADGAYHHRSRFVLEKRSIPYQPTTRWTHPTRSGVNEKDHVVDSAASALVVTPGAGIETETVVSASSPASDTISVSNLGSGSLSFSVAETPNVAWLSVTPTSGSSVVAGGLASTITLDYSTSTLEPGEYTTDIVITNVAVPTEQVVIPVTLTVNNQRFTPGDRLLGTFDVADDIALAEFYGVKGESLSLTFEPVAATPFKIAVSILDDDDDIVASLSVKLSKTADVKESLKLDRSGNFRLRFAAVNDVLGDFAVRTAAKFPKTAKEQVVAVEIKKNTSKAIKFLAMPGSILQFRLQGDVDSALTLGASTPDGNSLDFTSMAEAQSDGSLKVTGVFLEEVGQYKLDITNGGTKKAVLTVTIEPDQPIGSVDVTLP